MRDTAWGWGCGCGCSCGCGTLSINETLHSIASEACRRSWSIHEFLALSPAAALSLTLRHVRMYLVVRINTVPPPGTIVTLPLVWHPIRFWIRTFWEILLVFESLEINRARQWFRGGTVSVPPEGIKLSLSQCFRPMKILVLTYLCGRKC